ncbi:TIGR00730 family Rossman fold protein [Legionella anisa]|uniref:Cytokinin riboside 5'-monophosphate phosphoribohydrolase n=1 Tax=Legionella anisa TaxID=28082 RepID=A0AAX0WSV5_9GAMM|nr:TIGR00730 family Rossman fold protein [Legionella anisa]AWN73123.1 TIGR00730 family Rossman fold protein [Legionella anisa]KTC67442.1 lysine decarboxylase [Legionella anisa]MCW8423953.1 TIGR00730 family Rossman fold protein [Legionella anisa]MCW8447475.1 TIGR00730 family Rossman fold protein [Legionella anisa]PNL60241.1 TIGR00730 family Rossman fold protein [Legionella anisa]
MNNTKIIGSPTIGVYLGSNMGNNPSFKDAVVSLGKGIAQHGYAVVYGGGGTGLMGLLAQTVKSHGGTVIGITTEHLAKIETPSEFLDELHIASSMYERKRLIHEKSSQLIAMPGGIGTFDELFETWCAIKIGAIKKPFGLVNIEGYFNPMLQFVSSCTHYDLLNEQDIKIPTVYAEVSSYLKYLEEEQQGNFLKVYSNLNPRTNQDKHLIETYDIS